MSSIYQPLFVKYGGLQNLKQPYTIKNSKTYSFVVDASLEKLQSLCDKWLNKPSRGKLHYSPVTNQVMIIYAATDYMSFADHADHIGEITASIWVLVQDKVNNRTNWFLPYTYIGSNQSPSANYPCGYTIRSPRETYGLSAGWGDTEIQTTQNIPESFVTRTWVFEKFDSKLPAKNHVSVIEVKKVGKKNKAPLSPNAINPSLPLDRFPIVFLKQFRAIEDGTKACYQAIIEAPIRITRLDSGKELQDGYEITLQDYASAPIASDLGLEAGVPISIESAYSTNMDYRWEEGQEIWNAMRPIPDKPKKVAVLGGGMGSMATVFKLSSEYNWKQKYDITVYQMGWRLGGKGASGRNVNDHDRIEEHGVHVWLGFYQNAFSMMQDCYEELGRPPGAPLATWEDAFKKQRYIGFMEEIKGDWIPWVLDFPFNTDMPGGKNPTEIPTLWAYLEMTLEWLLELHQKSPTLNSFKIEKQTQSPIWEKWLYDLMGTIEENFEFIALKAESFLSFSLKLIRYLGKSPLQHTTLPTHGIIWLLENFLKYLWDLIGHLIYTNTELRRLWIVTDLAIANMIGMFKEGVFEKGSLDILDKYDYQEFLRKYGASEIAVNSAPIRGFYELGFAYENGDIGKSNFAAGAALRAILRMVFTYKGALYYRMQAGMGDTVFTPFYQVLKKRGVKFKFFHKVSDLVLDSDGVTIKEIKIDEQVTIKENIPPNSKIPCLDSDWKSGEYCPLVTAQDLACWPSKPNYDQIVQGDELKERHINLESEWNGWTPVNRLTLKRREDFDIVLLGISIGAFPLICKELIQASPAFKTMVEKIQAIQTQASQAWLNHDLQELGWKIPDTIIDGYDATPMDTWSDMSQLIVRESWPEGAVKNIAYFCGVMLTPPLPPSTDLQFPKKQWAIAKANTLDLLQNHIRVFWPNSTTSENPNGLNWDWLTAPEGASGLERFDAQFFRANVDPSERYVLTGKGVTQYRLKPGESGFRNLYLAGDWTLNGFNTGCIEACAIAGLQAASAIAGIQIDIVGEKD